MIDAHRVNRKLHRVLVEQVPRVGRLDNIQAIDREAHALGRADLEAHRRRTRYPGHRYGRLRLRDHRGSPNPCHSVHRREVLSDDRADAFVDEVTAIILKPHQVIEAGTALKDLRKRIPPSRLPLASLPSVGGKKTILCRQGA